WVVAGLCSFPVGNDKVIHKNQNRCRLNECPNADDQVECFPTRTGLVGVDASRHTQNSWDVHDIEGHVKADYKKPEMPFAVTLTKQSAGDFRVPVIEGGKQREQDSADDHVMKVSDYEVRETKLPIDRYAGLNNAGKTSDQELEQESDREQHRCFESDSS